MGKARNYTIIPIRGSRKNPLQQSKQREVDDIRNAADPLLQRKLQQREMEDTREEGDKGMSNFNTVLKKAKEATGLCMSELPEEMYSSRDLELTLWTALVDDKTMQKISLSNTRRLRDGVPIGWESAERNDSKRGALNLVNSFINSDKKEDATIVPFLGIRSLLIPYALEVTDTGLLKLAFSCKSLVKLNLRGCVKVTDVGIRALAKQNPSLELLDISYCTQVRGAGLVAVGNCCQQLKVLRIRRCPASEDWVLNRLATGLPELTELDLSENPNLKDDALKSIARRCCKLEKLSIAYCREISDVGVLAVTEWCKGLEYLDLTRKKLPHKITDVCLLSLAERCTCLTTLILPGNEFITDVGLSWLASGCHSLEKLNISKCFKITDSGLRALSEGCPELKWLNLSCLTTVSDVGMRLLGHGCRRLEYLNLSSIYLLTDGVQRDFGIEGLQSMLSFCTQLTHIILNGCFQVGPRVLKILSQGIDRVTELKSNKLGHQLHTLDLAKLPQMTSQKCLDILLSSATGDSLVCLNLSECENVDDRVLTYIGRYCSKLEILNISRCLLISGRGVTSMCRGSKGKCIQDIDLSFCSGINDLALLALSESKFPIKRLLLVSCSYITETGVAWLSSKVPTIQELNLKGCDGVSKNGLLSLIDAWKYTSFRNDQNFFGVFPQDKCDDMRFIDEYGSIFKAAVLIQTTYRSKMARRQMAKKKEQALMQWVASKLQAHWRAKVARKYTLIKRLQRNLEVEAAIKMQSVFRSKVAKKKAQVQRQLMYEKKCLQSAILIQNRWRGKLARNIMEVAKQKQRLYVQKCNESASKMQKIWRGKRGRSDFKIARAARLSQLAKEDQASIRLQGVIRGRKARLELAEKRRKLAVEDQELDLAAVKLQQACRGRLARKQQQKMIQNMRDLEMAALRVQCMWRQKTGAFAVQLIKQGKREAGLQRAALLVQCAWRGRKGKLGAQLIRMGKKLQEEQEQAAALQLQCIARKRLATKMLDKKREAKLDLERRQNDLDYWAAVEVQRKYRGLVGRKRATFLREQRMRRWKEMFDYEQDRPFYYHQTTGEVRWRKPQGLLDLLPRPKCTNCVEVDAYMECGVCIEMYCEKCWTRIHSGGYRIDHKYRSLYDAYEKRVDYGDGEWPSVWRTEIEQDELLGWHQLQRKEQRENGEEPTFGIPELEIHPDKELEPDISSDTTPSSDNNTSDENRGWRKAWDVENDREYYVDFNKRKITFSKPEEYTSPREEDCWKEYFDDQQYNAYYYYNHKTGICTYETPPGFENKNAITHEVDPIWTKHYHQTTGQGFYYNKNNGISTFDRPAEYITPREERERIEADKNRISDWVQIKDGETSTYYNTSTQQTLSERPPDYITPRQAKWAKYFDESTSRPYYYNETTNESQFMRPDGFSTPRVEGMEYGANGWIKYPDIQTGEIIYENIESGLFAHHLPGDFFLAEEEETKVMECQEIVPPIVTEEEQREDNVSIDKFVFTVQDLSKNDDWSDQGIERWIGAFAEHQTLEVTTPPLRPEIRQQICDLCDEFDFDYAMKGLGNMRSLVLTKNKALF